MEQRAQSVPGPELVFGLAGAVGTDLGLIAEILSETLNEVNYKSHLVHVIELLREINGLETQLKDNPVYDRYASRMDVGNEFREKVKRGDALALLSIQYIREQLRGKLSPGSGPASRYAYILRSLKHVDEVEILREVYGPGFFLISAYTPREIRRDNLARKIAGSQYAEKEPNHEALADELISRDEKEPEKFGQDLRDTFPLADVFVDASRPREEIKYALSRFIALLFNYQFNTPSREEYGMFHAYAAALRSAELGRQVGAVIASEDGEIISVGMNEVPKAGGGLYWPDDSPDMRDFQIGWDSSDQMKMNNVAEVLDKLQKENLLSNEFSALPREERISRAIPLLKRTRIMASIEFGRAVHAEMAAFMDAARRGISVKGAVLFTTTFPCHNCTRHIVTAGISKVLYIEPYAKSLGHELHRDSVTLEQRCSQEAVLFEPFTGIAPRQYLNLFRMGTRKNPDGTRVTWDKLKSYPRLFPAFSSYLNNEDLKGQALRELMDVTGLEPRTKGGHT